MVGVMQCLMWQGNGTAHWLVSSRIEPALSSCSTHMYNCRRARFGSVWGSCVGHPPVVTSPLLRGGLLVVLSPSIRTRHTDHPRGTSSGLLRAPVEKYGSTAGDKAMNSHSESSVQSSAEP